MQTKLILDTYDDIQTETTETNKRIRKAHTHPLFPNSTRQKNTKCNRTQLQTEIHEYNADSYHTNTPTYT